VSHQNTKRLFFVWAGWLFLVALVVVMIMATIPVELRQKAITAMYVVITVSALAAATLLYRLSWKVLRTEGKNLPSRLAFAMATVLVCEAVEQGWWVGIRLYRYLNGNFAPPSFYDHWIIASWITGLAISIVAIIPLVWRR